MTHEWDNDSRLYAVVRTAEDGTVDVVIPFPNRRTGELYAQREGFPDYAVGPISFLDGQLRPRPSGELSPPDPLALVVDAPQGDGHEMGLRLGTPVGEIIRTLAVLPPEAVLTDFYGDVELLLILREPDPKTA